MEKLKVEVSYRDDRGEIIDLLDHQTVDAVTLVTFRKGAVRGNHYHKFTTQWNYLISGRIKLVVQTDGGPTVETFLDPGDLVVTRPNERHALLGVEESSLMVFTRGPRGGKEYESDTFRLDAPLIARET